MHALQCRKVGLPFNNGSTEDGPRATARRVTEEGGPEGVKLQPLVFASKGLGHDCLEGMLSTARVAARDMEEREAVCVVTSEGALINVRPPQ